MGLEAKCNAKYGKQSGEGRAMWETDYLLFRGPFRVKVMRPDISSVSAKNGALLVKFGHEVLELHLGAVAAAKWADKILNPPSRLDKLGVKPGLKPPMRISVLGVADDTLGQELEERGADVSYRARKDSDIVFAGAESRADLDFVAWRKSIQPAGAIWIVYPKGVKTITEVEVMAAVKGAGLVDVKVCGFSQRLTAIKCVIPVADRKAQTTK